jgi:hypothetical protein
MTQLRFADRRHVARDGPSHHRLFAIDFGEARNASVPVSPERFHRAFRRGLQLDDHAGSERGEPGQHLARPDSFRELGHSGCDSQRNPQRRRLALSGWQRLAAGG